MAGIFNSTHQEAMFRLCFVCGEIVDEKDQTYEVEKYLTMLTRTLKSPSIFSIPEVTPSRFCNKCYSTLTHVDRGNTLVSNRKLIDWEECSPSCPSCSKLTYRKQVSGRKKKVSFLLFSLRGRRLSFNTFFYIRNHRKFMKQFWTFLRF